MDTISIMSSAQAVELLDGIAAALLSAAATSRARNFGAPLAGALILGCICGLAGPLAREIFLHGQQGTAIVLAALPDDVFIGALAALGGLVIWRNNQHKVFWVLDNFSLGFAASLGAVLAAPVIGIAGALVLGLVNGLTPSIIRDIALGDTAMAVEQNWYASSVIVGCICALMLGLAPAFIPAAAFLEDRLGEWATFCGMGVICGLRFWKGAKTD